jgi:hypothetical protein
MDIMSDNRVFEPKVSTTGIIRFAHRANSREVLDTVCSNPDFDVIEADIIFSEVKRLSVMGHPPAKDSDFSFDEWLLIVSKSNKGIKLDFKDQRVIEYCLQKLQAISDRRVFLNADILVGPGATETKFNNPNKFVSLCKDLYPNGILSVGWTTQCVEGDEYSQKNIDDMLDVLNNVDGQVTFPIRAFYLEKSWKNLQRLIEKTNYTLTIWNNEPVDTMFISWLKNTVDPQKTYIDLVNPDMSSLKVF